MTSTRPSAVLVTGATGRIGRLVVDELLRAGVPVRALTRRPESAALPESAEVVAGDFTAPESLNEALQGVGPVFLVWTAPAHAFPGVVARLAAHTSAEPRRVVLLSSPHRTPHPFFQQPNAMRGIHVEIERLLAASGLDVAILRPGMFASNARHWWGPQISRGDVVRWPYGAAETAPIDERDVAAVAARVMLDGQHANGDYVLTGPDEFRRGMAGPWPAGIADMLLSAWAATLGHAAYVTSTVQEILGSPPRTFHRWAVDNAAAFGRTDEPAG